MAVNPADTAPVATSVEALVFRDKAQRRLARMSAKCRRRRKNAEQLEHRREWLREPALDACSEVLNVRDSDDFGFRLPVEIRAVREEGVMHHVDNDTVLNLIFCAGAQLAGETCINNWVSRARACSCQRLASYDVTGSLNE